MSLGARGSDFDRVAKVTCQSVAVFSTSSITLRESGSACMPSLVLSHSSRYFMANARTDFSVRLVSCVAQPARQNRKLENTVESNSLGFIEFFSVSTLHHMRQCAVFAD